MRKIDTEARLSKIHYMGKMHIRKMSYIMQIKNLFLHKVKYFIKVDHKGPH